MNLELRDVTKDTVRAACALEIRDEQKSYVASNAFSIAQAHFEPRAVFRTVDLGEQPIRLVQRRKAEAPGTVEHTKLQDTAALLWRSACNR